MSRYSLSTVAVGDLAVRARVPAEVLVDADDVERRVLGLAAGAAGSRRPRRRSGASGRAPWPARAARREVVALHRAGPRRTARCRPTTSTIDGWLPLASMLSRSSFAPDLAHGLALEVVRLDRVHRDLRPDEEPERGRRARGSTGAAGSASAASSRRPPWRRGRCCSRMPLSIAKPTLAVVLVQRDAADVHRQAVERQPAVDDLDRADAALEPVARRRGASPARSVEAHVVERRVARRPQARVADADARPERARTCFGADRRARRKRTVCAAEAAGDADALRRGRRSCATVTRKCTRRRARAARQVGQHLDAC